MTTSRVVASLLAVALMFAPVVSAQDSGSNSTTAKGKQLPDAPEPNLRPAWSSNGPMPAQGYKGPMPSHGYYRDGDAYYPRFGFRQVADKHYWLMAVVLPSAASAFDAAATFHAVSLGHAEGNPLLGSRPTVGRVAGVKLGVGILQAIGIYRLKKHDMEADYAAEKHDGEFPPRWWKTALFAPALFL